MSIATNFGPQEVTRVVTYLLPNEHGTWITKNFLVPVSVGTDREALVQWAEKNLSGDDEYRRIVLWALREIPPFKVYECGCCNCWHPIHWSGDCRDDANRFGSPEEASEEVGWEVQEVYPYDDDDELNNEGHY